MDNRDYIPRLVWERDQARLSHIVKVMAAIITVLIIAIVAVVAAFLWHIHTKDKEWLDFMEQYDFESYDYEQDGKGVNIIGNSNGVDYYGAETESTQDEAQGR